MCLCRRASRIGEEQTAATAVHPRPFGVQEQPHELFGDLAAAHIDVHAKRVQRPVGATPLQVDRVTTLKGGDHHLRSERRRRGDRSTLELLTADPVLKAFDRLPVAKRPVPRAELMPEISDEPADGRAAGVRGLGERRELHANRNREALVAMVGADQRTVTPFDDEGVLAEPLEQGPDAQLAGVLAGGLSLRHAVEGDIVTIVSRIRTASGTIRNRLRFAGGRR